MRQELLPGVGLPTVRLESKRQATVRALRLLLEAGRGRDYGRLGERRDAVLERIGGELELQQLLPHLFLGPAQKDDIAGGPAQASENAAPKVEEFVDGTEDRAAARSPTWSRSPIVSCRRARRCASPRMTAIAQTRRAPRNRTNLASGLDAPPPGSGADFITLGRLGGQQLFDPLGCGCLVDALDGGKLAHQTVERGLVDLAFAVGLLRLAGVTKKIADHLGD